MTCRKLVIDTNVFYTLIQESPYKDKCEICYELLENILIHCYNKVCHNTKILEEYKKFERKTERCKYRTFYNKWKGQMIYNNKFEWVEPENIDVNIDHDDDHKFYQTAFNTSDKLFITQEEKLLEKRDEVFEHHRIKTMGVEDANRIVIIDGPVEFDNFSG